MEAMLAIVSVIASVDVSTAFSHSDDEWHKACPVIITETAIDGPTTPPIKAVAPRYPTKPHFMAEDVVVLAARIDQAGSVFDVRIEHTFVPEFVDGTLEAVRAWRYAPPMLKGKPACLEQDFAIEYRLDPCDPEKPTAGCAPFHPSYPGVR
ncbi:MAG: hypothetical protein GC190_06695 [Alphaproteobacteria bacterium]|nr:hypothetical protein [Alphaproteobacteria bacterium]